MTHDEWRKEAERKEAEYQAQRAARKADHDARIKAMLNEIEDCTDRYAAANMQARKAQPKSKPARKPRPSRAKTPAGIARWEAKHGATVVRC
jgi:hypothetical protein